MENQDYQTVSSNTTAVEHFDSGGEHQTLSEAAAPLHSDSVAAYISQSIDMDKITGDIQKIVKEHIENSIPDDKKLMMDLVSQVSALTGEVRQLRNQLDTKPYAVFTCPGGQMEDISDELAEIKQLLKHEPKLKSKQQQKLSDEEFDMLLMESKAIVENEFPISPIQDVQPIQPNPEPVSIPVPMPNPEPKAPEQPAPPNIAAKAEQAAAPTVNETVTAPAPIQQAAVTTPETEAKELSEPKNEKTKKKRTALSIFGNVLFYVVIIGIVLGAFLAKSGGGGQPTVIAGYSAFTVLSSSMEDTYPKGSLIISHSVDPNELEVGDDITFMASATSTITHRIISITEDYLDTGARAFETKGTMNENPDKEPVAAANVVGKVVFSSILLGKAASFVSKNWPLLLMFVVVLGGLFVFLRWNLRREEGDNQKVKKQDKQ